MECLPGLGEGLSVPTNTHQTFDEFERETEESNNNLAQSDYAAKFPTPPLKPDDDEPDPEIAALLGQWNNENGFLGIQETLGSNLNPFPFPCEGSVAVVVPSEDKEVPNPDPNSYPVPAEGSVTVVPSEDKEVPNPHPNPDHVPAEYESIFVVDLNEAPVVIPDLNQLPQFDGNQTNWLIPPMNEAALRRTPPFVEHMFFPPASVVFSDDPRHRLQWTPELHNCFAQAVRYLGGPRMATPRSVMTMMNVQGLTAYHIKSHLQKFRLGRLARRGGHHQARSNSVRIRALPAMGSGRTFVNGKGKAKADDQGSFYAKLQVTNSFNPRLFNRRVPGSSSTELRLSTDPATVSLTLDFEGFARWNNAG